MSDHSQNNIFAIPSKTGANPGWAAEPSIADMVRDPMFQQLMVSDRVSMECFDSLVSTVRERLAS